MAACVDDVCFWAEFWMRKANIVQKSTVYAMLPSPLNPWNPGQVSKRGAQRRLRGTTMKICTTVRMMGSWFGAYRSIATSCAAKKNAHSHVGR